MDKAAQCADPAPIFTVGLLEVLPETHVVRTGGLSVLLLRRMRLGRGRGTVSGSHETDHFLAHGPPVLAHQAASFTGLELLLYYT